MTCWVTARLVASWGLMGGTSGHNRRQLRALKNKLISNPAQMGVVVRPYRGPAMEFERDLVYIVQTAGGQLTLTPSEFAARFGWKNDPALVRTEAVK